MEQHAAPTWHQALLFSYSFLQNSSPNSGNETEPIEPAPCHRWAGSLSRCSFLLSHRTAGTWQISNEPPKTWMTISAPAFLAICLPDAVHRVPFVPEALLPPAKLPTATREVIRFPFSSPPHLFIATLLRVRICISCPLICGRKSKIQFGNP